MFVVQLGLPPRVAPPATRDFRVIEPAGRLLTPADIAPVCRALLAPPFDQPVIIDLGSVEELLRSAALALCDHISWRVYWSPVGVVAHDPDLLEHFQCRSFDRIATIHTFRSEAVEALSGRRQGDVRSASTAASAQLGDASIDR